MNERFELGKLARTEQAMKMTSCESWYVEVPRVWMNAIHGWPLGRRVSQE